MTWARFDDRLHQSAKLWRLSDSAFRLWVLSITFSNANRTDGELDSDAIAIFSGPFSSPRRRRAVRELVAVGCWEETPDGWRIHDFLEFNESSQEIERVSIKKAAGGSYGAHRRWHAAKGVTDPECQHCRKTHGSSDRSTHSKTMARARGLPSPSPSPTPSPARGAVSFSDDPPEDPREADPPAAPGPPPAEENDAALRSSPSASSGPGNSDHGEAASRALAVWEQIVDPRARSRAESEIHKIQSALSTYGEPAVFAAMQAARARKAHPKSFGYVTTILDEDLASPSSLPLPTPRPLKESRVPPDHPCHGRQAGDTWKDEQGRKNALGTDGWHYRQDETGQAARQEKLF